MLYKIYTGNHIFGYELDPCGLLNTKYSIKYILVTISLIMNWFPVVYQTQGQGPVQTVL